MSTPASDQNEPSKMKKLISGNDENSIRSRLPRGNGSNVSRTPTSAQPIPVSPSSEPQPRQWRFKFLPAFWTIASLMSITVNIVLIIILLIVFQMLGVIQSTANDKVSGLLGGLYVNFVKMDEATIASTIPVDAVIPLNISVPVQTTTQITLAQSATIPNAHVRINTGTVSIDADAVVTLPANTPLTVNLNFQLPVQNSIPVHLDVPVNIPLRQTQLHEPFVGLQKVVEPWYCLVEPNATVNGFQVCPSLAAPAPVQTVVP
jgi:hypothetical protein